MKDIVMNRKRVMLSIVIPVHNESEVIPVLLERLKVSLRRVDGKAELLFVDDGSTDLSVQMLKAAQMLMPEIRVLTLSRNFGKEAATSAGLHQAKGDAIVLMDADLQDPPELIPRMVEQWQSGFDVVLMKRSSRAGETGLKRLTSTLYYRLLTKVSAAPIPVDTGDFRLMSRRTVEVFKLLPERNRYLKGMLSWIGFPTTVIEYDRDPRAAGNTKWNYLRLMHLAMEGITSFSTWPLRMALMMGLLAAFAGGMFGFWQIIKVIVMGAATPGYASLIAFVTFLSGLQLVSVGLLGEYVGRIYIESKQRPVYVIAEDSALKTEASANVITHLEPARYGN
jgi:glycosyltransferase involved in cell wall biosynthesis